MYMKEMDIIFLPPFKGLVGQIKVSVTHKYQSNILMYKESGKYLHINKAGEFVRFLC